MKSVLFFGLLLSVSTSFGSITFSNTVDLPNSVSQVKIADAKYAILPTVTEIREIPGCQINEATTICTEEVVLKSEPVIQVDVTYIDGAFSSAEGGNQLFATLNFKLSNFSDEDVASLKAVYPSWKHPFSRASKNFVRNNLTLSVDKKERTIKVVDAKNSKFCRKDDSRGNYGTCKENIVYKNVLTTVKSATVSVN